MTFLATVSASAKEPMKRLTDRVFEVARQHCVNMDATLTYADYYYLEALLRYCGKL